VAAVRANQAPRAVSRADALLRMTVTVNMPGALAHSRRQLLRTQPWRPRASPWGPRSFVVEALVALEAAWEPRRAVRIGNIAGGRPLPVNPLHLLGKYEPASRHFFERFLYR
jgi:hypothetical protein